MPSISCKLWRCRRALRRIGSTATRPRATTMPPVLPCSLTLAQRQCFRRAPAHSRAQERPLPPGPSGGAGDAPTHSGHARSVSQQPRAPASTTPSRAVTVHHQEPAITISLPHPHARPRERSTCANSANPCSRPNCPRQPPRTYVLPLHNATTPPRIPGLMRGPLLGHPNHARPSPRPPISVPTVTPATSQADTAYRK